MGSSVVERTYVACVGIRCGGGRARRAHAGPRDVDRTSRDRHVWVGALVVGVIEVVVGVIVVKHGVAARRPVVTARSSRELRSHQDDSEVELAFAA